MAQDIMEVWCLEVVGSFYGWDVLGKAVWAETEQRSYILNNLAAKSRTPVQIVVGRAVLAKIMSC